jgi:hypothetical protein
VQSCDSFIFECTNAATALDVVLADRGVDDDADLPLLDAGVGDGQVAGLRCDVAGHHPLVPEPAGEDAGELAEEVRVGAEALRRWTQLLLDGGGGDPVRSVDVGETEDGDLRELHGALGVSVGEGGVKRAPPFDRRNCRIVTPLSAASR